MKEHQYKIYYTQYIVMEGLFFRKFKEISGATIERAVSFLKAEEKFRKGNNVYDRRIVINDIIKLDEPIK